MSKNRPSSHIKVQKKIKEMEGFECAACGSFENSQGHHLIPYSEGGMPHIQNMLTLCKSCHNKYHSGKLKIDIDRF
ncbi:HNH endonuclease [Candidatus Halobeggiatoa sp. HSG11]|nr:HNH endonuclease [Candidatus Halobeggiatoa sp. HSG11]